MTTGPSDPVADKASLARAVKSQDSTFTTFLVTPYSKFIARWAAGRSVAPTTVTVLSLIMGLAAAALFAAGQRPTLIAGALLLQLAFVADCVDGQLARYSARTSAFGGWLDAMGDRGKEYSVYAGLAVGSSQGFGDPIWNLALAALVLQTVRHSVDFGYAMVAPTSVRSVSRPSEGQDAPSNNTSPWQWLRRSLVLPIGERFALISVMAAAFSPRATFVVLLSWGAAAAAYSVIGKSRRTLTS